MSKLPSVLVVLSISIGYLYLFWYDSPDSFTHLNGTPGYSMVWHTYVLGIMINYIVYAYLMTLEITGINRVFVRALLYYNIFCLVIYLFAGPSIGIVARAAKPVVFFIFVGIEWKR